MIKDRWKKGFLASLFSIYRASKEIRKAVPKQEKAAMNYLECQSVLSKKEKTLNKTDLNGIVMT